MTLCAAALGACFMGLLWALVALEWPMVIIVKLLILAMQPKGRMEIHHYLEQKELSLPKSDDFECLSDSSSWSMVANETVDSPASACPGEEACFEPPPAKGKSSQDAKCKHTHFTRKGSNQFKTRITCLDCGELLVSKPTGCKIQQARDKSA